MKNTEHHEIEKEVYVISEIDNHGEKYYNVTKEVINSIGISEHGLDYYFESGWETKDSDVFEDFEQALTTMNSRIERDIENAGK